jgi:hypothetical protein
MDARAPDRPMVVPACLTTDQESCTNLVRRALPNARAPDMELPTCVRLRGLVRGNNDDPARSYLTIATLSIRLDGCCSARWALRMDLAIEQYFTLEWGRHRVEPRLKPHNRHGIVARCTSPQRSSSLRMQSARNEPLHLCHL